MRSFFVLVRIVIKKGHPASQSQERRQDQSPLLTRVQSRPLKEYRAVLFKVDITLECLQVYLAISETIVGESLMVVPS